MTNKITLKEYIGNADGIVQYKLDNKIGFGIFKEVDGVIVSKNIDIEFQDLKDICGEFDIDHLDGEE